MGFGALEFWWRKQIELTKPKNILVTKQIDQQWVKKATQHDLILYPIEFLSVDLISLPIDIIETPIDSTAFIFTSSNGVNGFRKWMIDSRFKLKKDNIAFSISGTTKESVNEIGFQKIYSAKNSQGLSEKIKEINFLYPGHIYYYFTCKDRLHTLEKILKKSKIKVEIKEVYKKELNPVKIDFSYDSIIFYSPSQVEAFLINNKPDFNVPVFCIGNTTGLAAKKNGFKDVSIAEEPNTECLIELIRLKNSNTLLN